MFVPAHGVSDVLAEESIRSIARGNGLAILSACRINLSLFWRRVFDRAIPSVLLINSALDMHSGK